MMKKGSIIRLIANDHSFCNADTVAVGSVGRVVKVDGVMALIVWADGTDGWAKREQLVEYDRRCKLADYAIVSQSGVMDDHLVKVTRAEVWESLRCWEDGYTLAKLRPVARLRVNKVVENI